MSIKTTPVLSPWVARIVLIGVLGLGILRLVAVPLLQTKPFGVSTANNEDPASPDVSFGLQDFATHLRFARAVWTKQLAEQFTEDNRSIYTVESHLVVVRDWIRPQVTATMPFGYSPTMLWVLGPFTLLRDQDAYLVWTFLAVVAIGLTAARPDVWSLLYAILCFLSPISCWCFQSGQTGILSTAAFLLLMHRSTRKRVSFQDSWVEVTVLWAFTAKPPLAVTAGMVILLLHGWRPVVLAVLLTVATTVVITPWMGTGWVHDYLQLISTYNSKDADPAFAWSLGPHTSSSNLRALLVATGLLNDSTAGKVCWITWIGALLALLLLHKIRQIPPDSLWQLAVIILLLFSPHLSNPEDVAVFLVGASVSGLQLFTRGDSLGVVLLTMRNHRWEGDLFYYSILGACILKVWLLYVIARYRTGFQSVSELTPGAENPPH